MRAYTTTDMKVSTDSCRSKDFVHSTGRGALERTSAVMRAFPGTCMILKSYLTMCKQNRKISCGKLSRFLVLSSESSGLWFVSRINDFPSKYIENLSKAYEKAKASFLSVYNTLLYLSLCEE